MTIFEEISAIAFQNGTEHLSTTSGCEMAARSLKENMVFSQNIFIRIDASIGFRDVRTKISPTNKRF